MSPQIQDPELSERLRRRFAIVGSSTIDTIAPELVGVVLVEDLQKNPDIFAGMGSTDTTGKAGDIPESAIRNLDPVKLLVVDRVVISNVVTGLINRIRLGDNAGGSANATGFFTDMRNPINAGIAQLRTAGDFNNVGGGGTVIWRNQLAAAIAVNVDLRIVLETAANAGATGRDTIHVDIGTAAARLLVTWYFHFEDPSLLGRV